MESSVNSLWPRTIIATAAIEFSLGGKALFSRARKPKYHGGRRLSYLNSENVL
jgi:citronellol/citronellal dehydrogenase